MSGLISVFCMQTIEHSDNVSERNFEKVDFEKSQQATKQNYHVCKETAQMWYLKLNPASKHYYGLNIFPALTTLLCCWPQTAFIGLLYYFHLNTA